MKDAHSKESLGSTVPEQLRSRRDCPSDLRPDVTRAELKRALLRHCKTSHQQIVDLGLSDKS